MSGDNFQAGPSLSREKAEILLKSSDAETRAALAAKGDMDPEILDFLSEDREAAVRQAVAANEAAPEAADQRLSLDVDEDVRCEIARKIARLLPDLEAGEQEKLSDVTLEILDRLSQDQLPKVRQALAEELKRSRAVPIAIIMRLARDLKDVVAVPVLQYSPLLSDDDLLELIAAGLATERLEAIARRDQLSEGVSDSVVASLDATAIASLLRNKNAAIREETLDQLADDAEKVEEWHKPISFRPDLSLRAIRRIGEFVAAELIEHLSGRAGLDDETRKTLSRSLRARVADATTENPEEAADIEAEVTLAKQAGTLNEEFVVEAMDNKNRALAIAAVARLAEIPVSLVEKMLDARTAKAVCALFWKAGLSMRSAVTAQEVLGRIPPKDRLAAKGGFDYPLSEDELSFMVQYFADAA